MVKHGGWVWAVRLNPFSYRELFQLFSMNSSITSVLSVSIPFHTGNFFNHVFGYAVFTGAAYASQSLFIQGTFSIMTVMVIKYQMIITSQSLFIQGTFSISMDLTLLDIDVLQERLNPFSYRELFQSQRNDKINSLEMVQVSIPFHTGNFFNLDQPTIKSEIRCSSQSLFIQGTFSITEDRILTIGSKKSLLVSIPFHTGNFFNL